MLIEYEVKYGGSCVKISQRIGSCSADSSKPATDPTGTISRSLGASYFEALGGSGLETGYPGGSGLPPTGTGGSGLPPTGTGGSGLPPTGTGGSGLPPTGTGGSGLPPTGTGGAASCAKPVVIFGPIVTWE